MEKVTFDRRYAAERREFHFTVCIPERRNGNDRRIGKNGKRVFLVKATNRVKDYIKTWLKVSRF